MAIKGENGIGLAWRFYILAILAKQEYLTNAFRSKILVNRTSIPKVVTVKAKLNDLA